MDSIPGAAMIELNFSAMHQDGPSLESEVERLLRIVADVLLSVDGRALYSEGDVPVVELASQLSQWLVEGGTRGDFSYESMESDTPGLIWIKRGTSGWRIGSVHQEYEETREWPLSDIDAAMGRFVARVIDSARDQLAVDVRDIVEGDAT